MPDTIKPAEPPAAPATISAAHVELVKTAESLGLKASDYLALDASAAKDKMLLDLAAKANVSVPVQPAVARIEVGLDQADKIQAQAVDAIVCRAFDKPVKEETEFSNRPISNMVRAFARGMGVRGVENWSKRTVAQFALGKSITDMRAARDIRAAANLGTGDFANFVALNAITKALATGFQMMPSDCIYQKISGKNRAPDFKTFYLGGMGTGNFSQVAENEPFPELTKSEAYYSSRAKMWGGTLSLTIQALMNDDTSQFEQSLAMAGSQAQIAIDKRTIQKLLMGYSTATTASTWTNNTTSGASIVATTADSQAAVRGRIGLARAGLMNKIGSDGNPTGRRPKFLVCGPTNAQYAYGALYPSGLNFAMQPGIEEILVSAWLELSTLAGYSTTSYYLGASPAEATGLVVTTVDGMESPVVEEYDAGAVAARAWKIYLPFEADLFSTPNSAGTTVMPAWQQATT